MNTRRSDAGHGRGFTLVELLIVVVIVGILTGIAVPSYRNYVIRVNRTEAKVGLTSAAQALERCFTRLNTYNDAGCTPLPPATNNYTFDFANRAANSFTVRATAIGGQTRDTACANFTLNQAGLQAVTGSKIATPGDCWNK